MNIPCYKVAFSIVTSLSLRTTRSISLLKLPTNFIPNIIFKVLSFIIFKFSHFLIEKFFSLIIILKNGLALPLKMCLLSSCMNVSFVFFLSLICYFLIFIWIFWKLVLMLENVCTFTTALKMNPELLQLSPNSNRT